MSDQTRLFLALILSMGAIYLYNSYFVDPKIEAQKKAMIEAKKLNAKNIQEVQIDGATGDELFVKDNSKVDEVSVNLNNSIQKLIARNDIISMQTTSRVKIDTARISGSINLIGARFDDISLKKHRKTLVEDSGNVVLLSPQNTEEVYFIRTGFLSPNPSIKTPSSNAVWSLESGDVLTESSPVTLTWQNDYGLIFKKKISIDDGYLINIQESITNNSAFPVTLAPFGLINQSQDLSGQTMFISHEGPIAVLGNVLEEIDYDDVIDESKIKFKKTSGWAGVTAKYWMSAIAPSKADDEQQVDISFKHYVKDAQNRFQVDMLAKSMVVMPTLTGSYEFDLYAGAKNLNLLDQYESERKIKMFDHAIDFGWLYFLTRPIFEALTYFNSILGNFGLAILLLTVCIRLILFPIANKSYKSMARMRKHMPEIQRMKERYGKDRQKLGQEMMKYYKSHRINPASGCLPMLIQIPVFFSLYKVLYVTIEMRHAPFYGWIKDLSAPDPTNIFNLFGLLPYTPPEWIPAIGVLPLLFSLTMALQQKLNPPPSDETQRMVMAWLPWIFLFLFASFPAGLVLYWVWNNILSIIQQYIITKRIEGDKNA